MENIKTKELRERIKRFIIRVIKLADKFPRTTAAYRITGQLIDATCSTGANFTEAQAARFKKEFVSIIGVVLRECRESDFWLDIIKSLNFLKDAGDIAELDSLITESEELAKIFGRIIITASKGL